MSTLLSFKVNIDKNTKYVKKFTFFHTTETSKFSFVVFDPLSDCENMWTNLLDSVINNKESSTLVDCGEVDGYIVTTTEKVIFNMGCPCINVDRLKSAEMPAGITYELSGKSCIDAFRHARDFADKKQSDGSSYRYLE